MEALLLLVGGTTGIIIMGIILVVALVSVLILTVCILLLVKILKDKKNGAAHSDCSDDTFMRMHNNFMDDSRRAHEIHMNMNNNMFH